MAADQIAFWVFAPISVGSAIAMVLQRNAVHAALFLVVNFFTIAVFYLVLGASFLFAGQIIGYAGAIMVLFLFVIMLLGVDQDESLLERLRGQRVIAVTLGVGIAVELIGQHLPQRTLAQVVGDQERREEGDAAAVQGEDAEHVAVVRHHGTMDAHQPAAVARAERPVAARGHVGVADAAMAGELIGGDGCAVPREIAGSGAQDAPAGTQATRDQ